MDSEQARCIYELMMLTAWADGRLEASEALVAEAVVAEVPELLAVPDKVQLAERAHGRLAQAGLRGALAETARGLRPEHRELAFVCCARVLEADGIIAREEFQVLAELKALFGLDAAAISRLLHS